MSRKALNRNSTLKWLRARRVAVLKGGWSPERSISLKTGLAVEEAFYRLGVRAIGIDVKRNIARVLKEKKIQFCFIGLHGPVGEDGRLQGLLDILKIPYTGSGPEASAIAMNKDLSKSIFNEKGIRTAPWITIMRARYREAPLRSRESATALVEEGGVFVKPVDQGSAIGVTRVDRPGQLAKALRCCFRYSKGALVEKFIPGSELTVGILGKRALPVIEILPKHRFYDFHSKYAKGGSTHIVPARIPRLAQEKAQTVALEAFRALNCSAYGRVDLMMQPDGEIFVLEVNTIPGLTTMSLLPDAARAVGLPFDLLVLRIVEHSLNLMGP